MFGGRSFIKARMTQEGQECFLEGHHGIYITDMI
jgi:hypothetical protein